MDRPALILQAAERLSRALRGLRFAAPVSHVYNPLEYASAAYAAYVRRYATTPKRVLFFGMNPGPYGMTQTGVPFGEVNHVRDWLGIQAEVGKPKLEHPARPVLGFACTRSEVSGARLWGLWRSQYGTPERFFEWAFVTNYCPLVFMEASGRNLTPDKLPRAERAALLPLCDEHLRQVVSALSPEWLVGVGSFAKARAEAALAELPASESCSRAEPRASTPRPRIGTIPHPSPASPAANRNWAELTLAALDAQGIPRAPVEP
jgi:single-strand selective monofunctional uracil DNA glycosylase